MLLFIVAIAFSLVLAYSYLGLDIDNRRLDVRDGLHYSVLVVHIFTAAVALVLGPLQFMPKVRAHKRIHRTLGRVYLLAGGSAVGGGRDPGRGVVRTPPHADRPDHRGRPVVDHRWPRVPGGPSARLHWPPGLDHA